MPTPNLALPLIAQGQAQKEITHNEALFSLDALVQTSVKSRGLATPPVSPASGDRYLVPVSATGVWSGQTDKIAFFHDGAWSFLVPIVGWRTHVEDERLVVHYADGAWRDRTVGTANGGGIRLVAIEQELTLTGAFVDATTAVIADRMIVLAVASRTTLAITGAASYSVGVAGNTSQFGGSLGIALGSTNIGVIGPTAFYAATPIRVTAAGGNFTGGKVRVVLYALAFAAPSA